MSQTKILLRVEKGRLMPADQLAADQLRDRGFRVGDQVNAEITKPRNPGHNRLAHAFGTLVADNIDAFDGLDCHAVLKRLQYEANVECDVMAAKVPGVGAVEVRLPRSLSFASMDQGRFEAVLMAMARHVAVEYWAGQVDAEEVIEMANEILGVAA